MRTLARRLWRRWQTDGVSGLAAEVAFFGVLSLFPAAIALAAAIGYLDRLVGAEVLEEARRTVLDFLGGILTDEASGTLDAVEQVFAEGNGELLSVAALGAVWASSRGAQATLRALATIHGVADRRTWLRRRLLSLAVALGTIVSVAVALSALVVGPLLGQGHAVASAVGMGDAFATAWAWARIPVAVSVLVAWTTVLYRLVPRARRRWRADLPGAALATLAWVAVSLGLRLYLDLAGRYNQVYGLLGGVIVVLVWAYLLSLGLLLGAVVNAVLDDHRPG